MFAQLLATIGVVLIAITIVGIPWALWKLVGWAFVQQDVLFTDKSLRESFRGSSDLVRGRFRHAARPIVFFSVFTTAAGPVLSFALIFTPLPLVWVNLVGSLIALLIPYVALGKTLLYFDLQTRAGAEPAKPRRSWRPWRPRQFGRVAPRRRRRRSDTPSLCLKGVGKHPVEQGRLPTPSASPVGVRLECRSPIKGASARRR